MDGRGSSFFGFSTFLGGSFFASASRSSSAFLSFKAENGLKKGCSFLLTGTQAEARAKARRRSGTVMPSGKAVNSPCRNNRMPVKKGRAQSRSPTY